MKTPAPTWLDNLPRNRLLAEFSIWSADLLQLSVELRRIEKYADFLHIDVSDGHFSPTLLFFPDLVASIRKSTALPLHVHLMADDTILLDQIRQFAEAGADLISIHAETGERDAALDLLDELGVLPGVVLRLEAPISSVTDFLSRVRLVTLLGTNIGVKGQSLDPAAGARLREARTIIDRAGRDRRILLAADGGIREHTVPLLRGAGAETVVMGSLAFAAPDLGSRMAWVHSLRQDGHAE